MNLGKAKLSTYHYAIIGLACSVLLLELIAFCSTGWMRLESTVGHTDQQNTGDQTRNRRSYTDDNSVPTKPPLGGPSRTSIGPRPRPNPNNKPATNRPDTSGGDEGAPADGPTSRRPSRPTKKPADLYHITRKPKPTPGQWSRRTLPPRRTRPTRGPITRRTGGPIIRPTKGPNTRRTMKPITRPKIPSTRSPKPYTRRTRLPFLTLLTRGPQPTISSQSPDMTKPPKFSLQSRHPPVSGVPPSAGRPSGSRNPDMKPAPTKPALPPRTSTPLPPATLNFIRNLVDQINITWSANTTVKFIMQQLNTSGISLPNFSKNTFRKMVAVFKGSNNDKDMMKTMLVQILSKLGGTNIGGALPGKPRIPNKNNQGPGSRPGNGKGTGVTGGLTDDGDGDKVVFDIGLWAAVICRQDITTGDTACERTGGDLSGIIYDRTVSSMVDVRIEAVFALIFGAIGSVCSVLMINPWCLKQKHRLLLVGGICGLIMSGLLYFITIARALTLKSVVEQEAGKEYADFKTNTPWCLYVGGLGAGLAFVTSGLLATSKWVEKQRNYSEFGDEVVFTKESDKPATEA